MKMKIKISIILIAAFLARAAAILMLGRHLNPQVWEYDIIALNIIRGNGYLYPHFNTLYHSLGYPLYPALCALFHYITRQNYFIIELFQAALSAGACYFIYRIGDRLFGGPAGLLAAMLTAVHPGLIIYSTSMHELSLVVFLITAAIWQAISSDWAKPSSNIITGAIAGLGILARPTFLFFLPAYCVFLWASSKNFKTVIRPAATVCVAAMLVIAPWTIRNYIVQKRLIFITTSSAEHFWRGNNPNASGSALTVDNKPIIAVAPEEFRERLFKLDEMGQYDLFYNETWKFIKSDPVFFMKMVLKKIYYFWWFSPQTGLWYPGRWTALYRLYYIPLFFFGVIGAALSLLKMPARGRPAVVFIIVFCGLVSLVHGLYYIETRHRWAIEPLILVFSGYGLLSAFDYLKRRL